MQYPIQHDHHTVTVQYGTERITVTRRLSGFDASFGQETVSFQRRRADTYAVTGSAEGTAVLSPKKAALFAAPFAERMEVHTQDIDLCVVQEERNRFSASLYGSPVGTVTLYERADLNASAAVAALILLCALAMEHYGNAEIL